MKTCEFCKKEFKKLGIKSHMRMCPDNPDRKDSPLKEYTKNFGSWNKGLKSRPIVTANCVVCDQEYEVRKNSSGKPHLTCSYACSNTYYRTGLVRDDNTYRTICFRHHPKICVCCNEINIIEVHHYDEDHSNNTPANLVPLCPTHHQYVHSRYKYLVNEKIDYYVQDFIKHCSEEK